MWSITPKGVNIACDMFQKCVTSLDQHFPYFKYTMFRLLQRCRSELVAKYFKFFGTRPDFRDWTWVWKTLILYEIREKHT